MIEHLGRERGLSREDAYILCALAGDLKITEVVDVPNWMVGMFVPDAVFVSWSRFQADAIVTAQTLAMR